MSLTCWKWSAALIALAGMVAWASAQDDAFDPNGTSGASDPAAFPGGGGSSGGLGGPPGMAGSGGYPGGMGMMGRSMSSGPTRPQQVRRTVTQTDMVPMTDQEIAEAQQLQEALAALQADNTDADKTAARQTLATILKSQFDRDVASREKDVKELESRTKKLREQLDKRKGAKDKIVELKLATIQSELDGLGFPEMGTIPASSPIRGFDAPASDLVPVRRTPTPKF